MQISHLMQPCNPTNYIMNYNDILVLDESTHTVSDSELVFLEPNIWPMTKQRQLSISLSTLNVETVGQHSAQKNQQRQIPKPRHPKAQAWTSSWETKAVRVVPVWSTKVWSSASWRRGKRPLFNARSARYLAKGRRRHGPSWPSISHWKNGEREWIWRNLCENASTSVTVISAQRGGICLSSFHTSILCPCCRHRFPDEN